MKVTIRKPYNEICITDYFIQYIEKKHGTLIYDIDRCDFTIVDFIFEDFYERIQVILDYTINPLIRKFTPRKKIRIDPWDTYDMDQTLSAIILPMLIQLKKNKDSVPNIDESDVPLGLRDSSDFEDMTAQWEWIMDEMIWAFDLDGDYHVTDVTTGPTQSDIARRTNALTLFGKYYHCLWE